MTKYILSYGGGVNSTALLFLLKDLDYPLDEVIFADTGAELPETYQYLEKIQNFCEDSEMTIVRILAEKVKVYEKVNKINPRGNEKVNNVHSKPLGQSHFRSKLESEVDLPKA